MIRANAPRESSDRSSPLLSYFLLIAGCAAEDSTLPGAHHLWKSSDAWRSPDCRRTKKNEEDGESSWIPRAFNPPAVPGRPAPTCCLAILYPIVSIFIFLIATSRRSLFLHPSVRSCRQPHTIADDSSRAPAAAAAPHLRWPSLTKTYYHLTEDGSTSGPGVDAATG